MVVHHVWRPRALWRVLHRVTERGRGRRRGSKVLLWWCHHVVGMGHHRGLAGIVCRVVVGGLPRARPTRVWLTGRRRVVVDGHGN